MVLLMAEAQDLKARLARDSQTSSQPPSRDKPWKSRSERSSSGKSTGGQVGHPGKTLKMSEHVDEVVVLPLMGLCGCGLAWEWDGPVLWTKLIRVPFHDECTTVVAACVAV